MRALGIYVLLISFVYSCGDQKHPNIQELLENFLKNKQITWKHTKSNLTSSKVVDLKVDVLSSYEIKGSIDKKKEKKNVDCFEILKNNPNRKNKDGVYEIYPAKSMKTYAFCDMTTTGGGWTVIQNRMNSSTDFYRTWKEYKTGFGSPSQNYWIGNDMIHLLTKNKPQMLRVELQRFSGEKGYAEYSAFAVGNETSKYRLNVSGYKGNIGDSLSQHNRMKFSTRDQDNDIDSRICSHLYRGAWWYHGCYNSNLNGSYLGISISNDKSNNWYYWKHNYEALKTTRLMIRPKNV
ncbi:microfibril-associated glycoprotein 4-like [Crassostrea virginica]|uniref:Microfibril-associated glycoprotein 4-like n=1 Tax=Crassostrea virginica TaxID=6565 RepID=A0A8B8B120_CRAVI|nr:microfibril-associated glycoprotein 4-like [Crassostrea virginica]